MPPGRTTATWCRRCQRRLDALHPACSSQHASVFDSGATSADLRDRPGRHAQSEYLYCANYRRIDRGREGQFQAAGNNQRIPRTTQTVPFQRAFAVEAQNVTSAAINVRFTIANQPTGGKASFLQFSQQHHAGCDHPGFFVGFAQRVRDLDQRSRPA